MTTPSLPGNCALLHVDVHMVGLYLCLLLNLSQNTTRSDTCRLQNSFIQPRVFIALLQPFLKLQALLKSQQNIKIINNFWNNCTTLEMIIWLVHKNEIAKFYYRCNHHWNKDQYWHDYCNGSWGCIFKKSNVACWNILHFLTTSSIRN